MTKSKTVGIPDEIVVSKIFLIRGHKVMLDRDLAELYGVKAIRLREQVKRNPDRFPKNFMFQLSDMEVTDMVSQNAIPSRKHLGGAMPYVFTEHGVLMLANVLKSRLAIQMSVRIIEIFVRLREMLLTNRDILLKVEQMEKRMGKQDDKIQAIFDYLKQFIQDQEKPMVEVGFKRSKRT